MTAQLALVDDGPGLLDAPVRYFGAHGEAVTEAAADDLTAHLRRYGPQPVRTPATVLALLERAALTGRGGAHFPVAAKWRAVRTADGTAGTPVVVANGAEGEPLSGKDAALLELRPHLVLDGLVTAAQTVAAGEAVVWLHESSPARATVAQALTERSDPVPIRIAVGPDHYLSGESGAVVRALSGGPALPDFRRVPAAVSGVHGRPTLVQNVETLARAALVTRGLPAASALLTLALPGHRVVVEVDAGTRLGDVLRAHVGASGVQAVLLGGYGGSWVRWADAADLPVDEPALRVAGLSLGAGVVLPWPEGTCALDRVADLAEYLADSSARQCGPCLFGLDAVADVLDDLAAFGSRRRDEARLRRFLGEIAGRGGCHHPDGAVRMVSSALAVFADDVAAHLRGSCLHARRARGRRRG